MITLIEKTPDRVRFVSAPPLWLMGLAAAVVLGACFLLVPASEIRCTRANDGEVDCSVTRKLLGFTLSSKTIRGIEGAALQESEPEPRDRSTRGNSTTVNRTTRVVLETANGPVPMFSIYSANRAGHEETAAAINAFLKETSRREIAFIESPGAWLLGIFTFMLLVFLALVFQARTECLLDRSNGIVQITRGRFPKFKSEYRLSEVDRFLVIESEVVHAGSRRRYSQRSRVYGLGMRLKTGREVRLCAIQSAGGSRDASWMSSLLERARQAPRPPVEPGKTRPPDLPVSAGLIPAKICVVCGEDCASAPRFQDDQGRYYHTVCYHKHFS
jgi:hypothetical protein